MDMVGGSNPSEKYEFVNWDDDIPNFCGNIKNVPNHQPAFIVRVPSVLLLYDVHVEGLQIRLNNTIMTGVTLI